MFYSSIKKRSSFHSVLIDTCDATKMCSTYLPTRLEIYRLSMCLLSRNCNAIDMPFPERPSDCRSSRATCLSVSCLVAPSQSRPSEYRRQDVAASQQRSSQPQTCCTRWACHRQPTVPTRNSGRPVSVVPATCNRPRQRPARNSTGRFIFFTKYSSLGAASTWDVCRHGLLLYSFYTLNLAVIHELRRLHMQVLS